MNIDNIFRANAGIITETALTEQKKSIQMIQHILDLVNNRYRDSIVYSAIFSNEDILKVSLDKAKDLVLFVVIKHDVKDSANVENIIKVLIKDEISWHSNISLTTLFIDENTKEFTCPKRNFCLPITSNSSVYNNDIGKFIYSFCDAYSYFLEKDVVFYVPEILFSMRKVPLLIDGMCLEDVDTVSKSEFADMFYIIKLNNLAEFSRLVQCSKVNKYLLQRYLED